MEAIPATPHLCALAEVSELQTIWGLDTFGCFNFLHVLKEKGCLLLEDCWDTLACRNEFPLYVSQDGPIPNQGVAELAKSFATKGVNYLHHKEETVPVKLTKKENVAYYRIANHYKFILYTLFDCFGYKRLIIVEVRASFPSADFVIFCILLLHIQCSSNIPTSNQNKLKQPHSVFKRLYECNAMQSLTLWALSLLCWISAWNVSMILLVCACKTSSMKLHNW